MRRSFRCASLLRAKAGRLGRECGGAMMLEAVVAISVFALVGTAVLAGISTVHITGARVERQSVAENLARNQMEYAFTQSADGPYESINAPVGYAVTAEAEEYLVGEPNIEKVVVTVSRDGSALLVVETLRAKE